MFGERICRLTTEQKLGLREFAAKVGISPTYLSRIETSEEKAPPAEEVIRKMATQLSDRFDELMTLAGRVSGSRSTSSRPTRGCRSSCARLRRRGHRDIEGGRVYLELADATPAEAARGMALLTKLVG